ncbi:MAG: hypothetical protein AAF639_32880 [Chloroflexota bacterium]
MTAGSFLLFIVLTFAFFIAVMFALIWYTQQIANFAITRYFRDAEDITDGRVPKKWVRQINRQLFRRSLYGFFLKKQTGTDLALDRLAKLTLFFENSSFFESEEAREILLEQFADTRKRWQLMSWEQLMAT